jgi:hypothetical protein
MNKSRIRYDAVGRQHHHCDRAVELAAPIDLGRLQKVAQSIYAPSGGTTPTLSANDRKQMEHAIAVLDGGIEPDKHQTFVCGVFLGSMRRLAERTARDDANTTTNPTMSPTKKPNPEHEARTRLQVASRDAWKKTQ